MDWKQAILQLAAVMPKLAFKEALVTAVKNHASMKDPPALLMTQLEVILSVAIQNERVAQLHGYPGLEQHAKKVEVCVQNVLSALKNVGMQPHKSQQASSI